MKKRQKRKKKKTCTGKRAVLITALLLALIVIIGVYFNSSEQYNAGSETEKQLMTIKEAREIAMQSYCVEEGNLKDTSFYNEYTKTWWIDMDMERAGCSPACVVDAVEKTAEINWRCTGLEIP